MNKKIYKCLIKLLKVANGIITNENGRRLVISTLLLLLLLFTLYAVPKFLRIKL